jgi:hypothetical protein
MDVPVDAREGLRSGRRVGLRGLGAGSRSDPSDRHAHQQHQKHSPKHHEYPADGGVGGNGDGVADGVRHERRGGQQHLRPCESCQVPAVHVAILPDLEPPVQGVFSAMNSEHTRSARGFVNPPDSFASSTALVGNPMAAKVIVLEA